MSIRIAKPLMPCLFVLPLCLFLCACSKEIKRQQLNGAVDRMMANTFQPTLYYMGSGETYDYYCINLDDSRYRVARAENDQTDRMPFTSNRAKWRYVRGAERAAP